MDWQPGRKSKKGRSRQRWMDSVLADVEKLRVQDWNEAMRIRQKWKKLAERIRKYMKNI